MTQNTFRPLSLAELWSYPPRKWLVENLIGPQDLVMVFASPGVGKTLMVIDFLFSAVLGSPWAGKFQLNRPLTVAYCSNEGRSALPQRFRAAARKFGIDKASSKQIADQLTFYFDVPHLYNDLQQQSIDRSINNYGVDQFVKRHLEHIKQNEWGGSLTPYYIPQSDGASDTVLSAPPPPPLDLLVIDTFHSASMGAEENSARDAGTVLDALDALRKRLGCAILLVHHPTKQGGAERGSGAYRAAMDLIISIGKPNKQGVRTVACEKSKDAQPFDKLAFKVLENKESASANIEWTEIATQPAPSAGEKSKTPKSGYAERVMMYLSNASAPRTAREVAKAVWQDTDNEKSAHKSALAVLKKLVEKGKISRNDSTVPHHFSISNKVEGK